MCDKLIFTEIVAIVTFDFFVICNDVPNENVLLTLLSSLSCLIRSSAAPRAATSSSLPVGNGPISMLDEMKERMRRRNR